jgi:hypothetical protein
MAFAVTPGESSDSLQRGPLKTHKGYNEVVDIKNRSPGVCLKVDNRKLGRNRSIYRDKIATSV